MDSASKQRIDLERPFRESTSGAHEMLLNRLLIFGGSGFLGREVIRQAETADCAVEAPNSAVCDLADLDSVDRWLLTAPTVERVVFLASAGGRRDSIEAARRDMLIGCGCARIISKLRPTRLIYVSSVDVYGRPPAELPISEETALRPDSYYGVAKLSTERMVAVAARASGSQWLILRLPGVYGADDNSTRLVANLRRSANGGPAVLVNSNGGQRRDLVWSSDVARFIVKSILDSLPCDVLNFATGKALSVREICRLMSEAGLPLDVRFAGKQGDDYDLCFDTAKLSKLYAGFRFTPWRESFAQLASLS
jgi:nucleoside-diphosphate-sugar epimerase